MPWCFVARVVFALGLLSSAAAMAASPVDLLSHRAYYRVRLDDSRSTSLFAAVRGALVIEWRATCEGSLSSQRLGFVGELPEGGEVSYDVRFTSWESPDERKMRFALRSYDGADAVDRVRGEAELRPDGTGIARYQEPKGLSVELPEGTLFPTSQMRRLLQDARAGRAKRMYRVFDGSGPEALSLVAAAIGLPRKDPQGRPVWPVSLAYYPGNEPTDVPDFEISFTLGEGGVMRAITLDYGDFVLRAKLEKLDLLDAERCE